MTVKVNELKLTGQENKVKVEIDFEYNNGNLKAKGVTDNDALSKNLQRKLFNLHRDVELELNGTDTSNLMSTYSNCKLEVVESDEDNVACSIITNRIYDKDKFNLNKTQLEELYINLGNVLNKNN